MNRFIIVHIFLTLLFVSCSDDLVEDDGFKIIMVDTTASLIPSKIGNEWIYLDSLSIGDSIVVTTYKSKIESEELIDGAIFYIISNLYLHNYGLYKYTIRNDSIFSRFLYEYSTEYYLGLSLPPIRNSEVMFVRAPDGIGIIGKQIKNIYQRGKLLFSEYYEYKSMDYLIDRQEKLIIVPGVGVVEYFLYTNYYTGKVIKKYKHRVSLMSYNLK